MPDALTPYPLMFCPEGVEKPACCPHLGQVRVLKGPEGLPGICWGGAYEEKAGTWSKTPAGWFICLNGHQPQHLVKMDTHPRILRWRCIPGALEDQWWRIPVLLASVDVGTGEGAHSVLVSALDRLWTGTEWAAPADLRPIQEQLLAAVTGIPLDQDLEKRNAAVRSLVVDILKIAQWVDADLLAQTQWLSERLMGNVLYTACDVVWEGADAED